jgi:hypothetical protein
VRARLQTKHDAQVGHMMAEDRATAVIDFHDIDKDGKISMTEYSRLHAEL